jgi:hypothetical protein
MFTITPVASSIHDKAPVARLNDEGTIAGSEGDLVSTVTMMWVRELLGEVAWMASCRRKLPPTGAAVPG